MARLAWIAGRVACAMARLAYERSVRIAHILAKNARSPAPSRYRHARVDSNVGTSRRLHASPTTLVGTAPIVPIRQAFAGHSPETIICEQDPLDARDGVAHRLALFLLRGQMGGPWPARDHHRHRADAGRQQRAVQSVARQLLQRPAGTGLERVRLAVLRLLYARRHAGRASDLQGL